MAKKILLTLAGYAAVVLALAFVILILLNQSYFPPVVVLALSICAGLVILYMLFLAVSGVVDIVRRRGEDEEALDEKQLEKMIGAQSQKSRPARSSAEQRKAEQRRQAEEKAIRKQAEYEAKKAAEAAAEARKREAAEAKRRAEAMRKIQRISAAELAARTKADEAEDEEERTLCLAEAEALHRAVEEAKELLAAEDAARRAAKAEEARKKEQDEAEMALRRQQAVESARKQAEAAATARRRAAQVAARTQSFAPVATEQLPAVNNQVINRSAHATGTFPAITPAILRAHGVSPPPDYTGQLPPRQAETPRVPPVKPPQQLPRAEESETKTGSIWERMQVRQSAKPPLPGAADSTTDHADEQAAGSASWTYAPAKLPDAWRTHAGHRSIPGELPSADSAPAPKEQADVAALAPTAVEVPASLAQDTPPLAAAQVAVVEPSAQRAEPLAAVEAPPPAAPLAGPAPAPSTPVQPISGGTSAVAPPDSSAGFPPAGDSVQSTASAAAGPAGNISAAPLAPVPRAAEGLDVDAFLPAAGPGPGGAPQPAVDAAPAPRKRGRPPKPKDPEELNKPKRPRGRPPKPKDPEELNKPKRPRGRPPKPKDPEELNKPKRPRGRPRKYPLPEDQSTPTAAPEAASAADSVLPE